MSVVRLPRKNCDHHHLIAAIVDSGLAEAETREIKVQFQPTTFMTTSALAQLCSWGLLRKTHGCTFRFLGEKRALAYPSRIDLFRHLEFEYEEAYNRRDESGRFIPLRLLTDRGASLADAVEAVCELVRKNVAGANDFLPALRWVVQELTDNVGNHAESPTPGVLCAQLYPRQHRIDIAISDMGRGIKASLSGRYPKIWSHGDAITKAMEPGVTRDLAAGQGNGLSGSREIIMANGGGLNIWTGNADLAFVRGRKKGFRTGPELPGTGVSFSLRTNHPVDLRKTTLFDRSERTLHQISRVPSTDTERVVLVDEHCVHVGGCPTRDRSPDPRPVALSGMHIPLAKLHELPVPAPDGRITKLVRQLARTSAELRRVADEFDGQRRELFGIRSPREQVAKCEETSRIAVTLDRAMRTLDDSSERIRLLFPLPLALSWRVMELTESPRECYGAMLQVFEATVGYLAAMLVADLRAAAAELEAVPSLLDAFHTPGRGPTLGDWVQLLRQAPPSEVSDTLESSSFPELRVLLSEAQERSKWWSATQALLGRRNDHAHGRGPESERKFRDGCDGAQGELNVLFSRLGFLARYRLTLVMDCAFDELTSSRTARIKELTSDHWVVPVQEISCNRELGRGLYFADARGDLTLCSPWMEYTECPRCGDWEVTIPEYWSKEPPGGTCYKALRTGHIHRGRPENLARIARFVGAEEPE